MSSKLTLQENLGDEWYGVLKDEFSKKYMSRLRMLVSEQKNNTVVYPSSDNIFNAYRSTPLSQARVCIVGQDPYIQKGQAHGLSFSTYNGKHTPSLKQIEAAVRQEIYQDDTNYVWSNNLLRWAEQGVFLLNSVLTVNAGQSNSHKDFGWENFTLRTIEELDKKGVIFLLWGGFAQKLGSNIKNSMVLSCEHPVAASYQGRKWNNNECFSRVNSLLDTKINW